MLFAVAIAVNPDVTVQSARQAFSVCINSLVPSLFPFFVCTLLLMRLGTLTSVAKKLSPVMMPLFGVGGAGALPFVMGIVGGYPVGAKVCTQLVQEGDLSKSEAEKLLAFCNNSGPLFVLGAVGSGMIGDAKTGICLYLAHIASALTVAFLMRGIKCTPFTAAGGQKNNVSPDKITVGGLLSQCVGDAAESTVKICGFVIVFKILMGIIGSFIKNRAVLLALYSVLELSGGCASATDVLGKNPLIMCMAVSAIIGWSGISVHLQVASEASAANLSLKKYFLGKMVMAAVSPFYTWVIMSGFCKKAEITVFAPQLPQSYAFGIAMAVVAAMITTVVVMVITALYDRNKFSNNY